MSQENVEKVRSAIASGPDGLLAILHDEVEWDYVGAFPEAATYHGPEQVAEFLRGWVGGFDDFGFEADQIIDAGESVLVLLHQWGRGKDTGARVESRTWQVLAFRGAKVVH
jgi:ketosteroid isomerase-like protein